MPSFIHQKKRNSASKKVNFTISQFHNSKLNRQLFLICFIFIGLFSACRKESEEVEPQTKTDAIQKAKQWFANRKALSPPLLKSGENPLTEADREPDWDNTDLQTHLAAPLLEMPLKYENKYLMSSYRDPETGILKTGITKLLLRQENDSIFKPIIMRIYGDSAYLAQAGNQFEENTFTQIASDFSGEVFYYDWQENFLGANRYKNGELTDYIKNTGLKSFDCITITTYYWRDDNSAGAEVPGLVTGGSWESSTETHCWMSDDSPGGNGGGGNDTSNDNGNGGGSGSGSAFDPFCLTCDVSLGNPPVIPDVSVELLAITKDWYTMTDTEWKAVDEIFKKGLENPYIKKMYDKLAANPPFKIAIETFEEDDDINKSERLGSYREEYFFSNNQFSKGIRLNKKLISDPAYKQFFMVTLFAELTHVYQHWYYQGEYNTLKQTTNIECEQRFFIEYVDYMSRDTTGKGIFNMPDNYSFAGSPKDQKQLETWLETIKNAPDNKPTEANSKQTFIDFFMPRFKEVWKNTSYGTYPILPNEALGAIFYLFP